MAHHRAGDETAEALLRLKIAIIETGHSLRGVTRLTADLDPPERLYHSNMSRVFRRQEGRDLYLQAFLAICRIIGRGLH